MEQTEILKELNDVFIDVLDDEGIILNNETTANDIDQWDSITHFQLVVAIEKRFKVVFNSMEIQNWKNIGEMIESIHKKLPS